jgi:hypothetical protein
MVKVAEPVLGMFLATTMPSPGWMLPLVWILIVIVLKELATRLKGDGKFRIEMRTRLMGWPR